MIITIITVILVISFLVFTHELGHFLGARAVGVKVLEFSIGFPPKLISKTIGETKYMISLIPIGGFVRMLGQNVDDEDADEDGNYASKSIPQRLVIIVAGPLMNLIVAILLMPLVFWMGYDVPAYMLKAPIIEHVIPDSAAEKLDIIEGDRLIQVNGTPVENWRQISVVLQSNKSSIVELTFSRERTQFTRRASANLLNDFAKFGWEVQIDPIIGEIAPNSPAKRAGILKGDRIISINETQIKDWGQISPTLQKTEGKVSLFVVERNRELIQLQFEPEWNKANTYWVIGVTSQTKRISERFSQAVILGAKRVVVLTKTTYKFLFRLISGKEKSDSIGGPIMIATMVGQAAHTDFSSLIALVAFISLQFCIFNLLPIPALDGGHVLFLLFEKIKGQTLSIKFRLTAQKIGFSLLMMLIFLISIQDTVRVLFK